jgi:hypothetical protein
MVDARKVGLVEQIEVVDATREDRLHEFGIVLPRLLAICHASSRRFLLGIAGKNGEPSSG